MNKTENNKTYKINIHGKNVDRLMEIIDSLKKSSKIIFNILSPEECNKLNLVPSEIEKATSRIRQATRSLKNYRIIGLPKCIILDNNIRITDKKDMFKPETCKICSENNSCKGINKSFVKEGFEKSLMQPLSSKKSNLLKEISEISSEELNKTHEICIINGTTRCNVNCIFCNEGPLHKNKYDVPKETIIDIADKMKSKGIKNINFMGGEFTIREDSIEILKSLKDKGMKTGIATNCIKFSDEEYCKNVLSNIDFMEISVHSLDEQTFNSYTRSGNYSEFIKGLENISKINKEFKRVIIVNILIGNFNHKSIPEITKYIVDNFSKEYVALHYRMIEKDGFAEDDDSCMIGFMESKENLISALEIAEKADFGIKIDSIPMCLLDKYKKHSRFIFESIQKINQYYLNKIIVDDETDVMRYHNKHVIDRAKQDVCRKCLFDSICRGVEKNEIKDYEKIIEILEPITSIDDNFMKSVKNSFYFKSGI